MIYRSKIITAALLPALLMGGCMDAPLDNAADRQPASSAQDPVCYGLNDDSIDVVISLQPLSSNRYEAFGFGTWFGRRALNPKAFRFKSEGELMGGTLILDMNLNITVAGRKAEQRSQWRIEGRRLFAEDWRLDQDDCRRLTSSYLERDIRRKKDAEKLGQGKF